MSKYISDASSPMSLAVIKLEYANAKHRFRSKACRSDNFGKHSQKQRYRKPLQKKNEVEKYKKPLKIDRTIKENKSKGYEET